MIRQIKYIFNQHLALSIAVIITLAVYSKFLFFGHISWDDPDMVFKNKAVQTFDLKSLFTDHYVGNYIPVTMFFHAIAWFLFGNNDWGHHLVNILFHVINGILVYQAGKRIFKNETASTFASVVFLLHPLQVESVGWISELKNILSTTFYLLALISYLNYSQSGRVKYYIFCFLFFILGCFSKSSVVVFPLVLIVLDLFLKNKFEPKQLLNKIPLLIISIIVGLINMKTQTADLFINYSHAFPYPQRIGFAGFALVKYMLLFLVPAKLSVIYPYPAVKTTVFITGYILITATLILLFLFAKKKNYNWIFIILFVILNLALVLQFVPFGEVLYADRYMYIPMIGFGWIIGILLSRIKIPSKFITLAFILIFSLLTFSRSGVWSSAISLYEDIIRKYPDQFIALNSAGVESMFINNDEKALEYLNRAIKAAPQNYKGYYNRGLLYIKNNKPELAIKSFNQTLDLYEYSKAYVGRASAYYMLNDFPKAINDATHVLSSEPNNIKAHFILGNCYNDMNKLNEAMAEYNKCIELNPDEAEYYFKRAIVYGKKQDFQSCLNDLNLCLKLNSNYIEAYYWRGVAKVNQRLNPCEDFKIAAQNNFQPAVNAFNKYCR